MVAPKRGSNLDGRTLATPWQPRSSKTIAEIAVNAPVAKLFHYEVPPALLDVLKRGHRVLVPFGGRTLRGVCIGFVEKTEVKHLKPIQEVIQPECRFDNHLLELSEWIAKYYHASWGEVLEAALPPTIRQARRASQRYLVRVQGSQSEDHLAEEADKLKKRAPAQCRILKHLMEMGVPQSLGHLSRHLSVSRESIRKLEEKGLLEIVEEERPLRSGLDPSTLGAGAERAAPTLQLHAEQKHALAEVLDLLDGKFGSPPPPLLIHGVTGSGKTEVYLRALERVVAEGGRGLLLVPEIALTPQTVRRFTENLHGVPIAILHSMLSPRERAREWRDVQEGRVGVVIGARSAVFAPIPNLRLIIVDEEHEPSYKQESSPRYNGRDVAVVRARLLKIPVVLGSATPSLESYHNTLQGKYRLVEITRRATHHDLPNVTVVPLTGDFYRADGSGLISPPLDYQIRQCLQRQEQVILFLNRRGFSTFLHCLQCGLVFRCEHCDIALTYHRRAQGLRCHYCDSFYPMPSQCPDCHYTGIRRLGVGTERVAETVAKRYPNARIGRLDRDAITNHRTLRATLECFLSGDFEILVGTQMVAKGHDFPRVSLVGIISADTGLHFPDFRSAERTFQIVTQVAGRAGRGKRPGQVIVQTFFPDHYAISFAVKADYRSLYNAESEHRQALGYPPFGRVAKILVQADREKRSREKAAQIARLLKRVAEGQEGVEILGPAPSPISRIQARYRFQVLVKSRTAGQLLEILHAGSVHADGRLAREVIVDVDPQSLL